MTHTTTANVPALVTIIGAGPAGLMAAEVLSNAGIRVQVFDAMPSVGRKFLLAGIGGLNLTHSEPLEAFITRYAEQKDALAKIIRAWGAPEIRAWAQDLGVETFVGTSGRVFPVSMKAAPLLRAWLHRLRERGVQFHMRHRWVGWDACGNLLFEAPSAQVNIQSKATILALGGASWPRLGSDGAWVSVLQSRGVGIAALKPANCGFDTPPWTEHFKTRFSGQPFKLVSIQIPGTDFKRKGEFVATATGVEGSLIYAAAALLREQIAAQGSAIFQLDLLPDMPLDNVQKEVSHPRGARSLSSHLNSRLRLDGIKLGILYELLGKEAMHGAARLAAAIKALPVKVVAPRPISEVISTAGGVRFDAMNSRFMLNGLPGVFCAGEMLDWEAPTGGYLLTAAMATGRVTAQGALDYLVESGAQDKL